MRYLVVVNVLNVLPFLFYVIVVMKQVVHLMVDVPDCLKTGEFKTVFHCAMTVDDSLMFDYTHVLMGLHCLFPDGIITIKIM